MSNLSSQTVDVAGMVHPMRPQYTVRGTMPEGSTVYCAIEEALKSAKVRKKFINHGIAQVGTRDTEKNITVWRNIPRKDWKARKLQKGELLRFKLLPQGGGGGGKNPLRSILMAVVAVVAIVASYGMASFLIGAQTAVLTSTTAATATAAASTTLTGLGVAVVGTVGVAVSTVGMALVDAIAPVKAPSFKGLDRLDNGNESPVYGISAGRNRANQWGRVPVPLGTGRFAPPMAAMPYTHLSGDDIYLYQLFCIGIGDIEFSDLKIGTNAIEDYNDCEYEYFTYDPQNPRVSSLYPTGVRQQDLNVELTYNVPNSRTINDCEKIELDFMFQGLGYFNKKGGVDERSVGFSIEYRKSTDTGWNNQVLPKYHGGIGKTYIKIREYYFYVSYANGVSYCGRPQDIPSDAVFLGAYRGKKETRYATAYINNVEWVIASVSCIVYEKINYTHTPTNDYDIDGFSISLTQGYFKIGFAGMPIPEYAYFSISGGTVYEKNKGNKAESISYSGAVSTLLRKTFTIHNLERGNYDVRITRTTPDSDDDKLRNQSAWTAIRGFTGDLPVNTKYPVNLLALKIRATGQLNGTVDTLSGIYNTSIQDWDFVNKVWTKRYTSNPAAIFRYVLQQEYAMARPQPDSVIDLESIQEAYEHFENMKATYNLVCDSNASVFERLQNICAVGYGSPTMNDAKWAIVVDKPRENIACAFTSANSWGWKFAHKKVRLPNAIHCTFINEATWDTDMRIVEVDSDVSKGYVYESQMYEGVNDPDQVYQLARFHYADAKLHTRTISMRAYDEAIMCTRGDLVECAVPSVAVQGLQAGRVRLVMRDADKNVTEIYTDQSQTTDLSGRRFGVKIWNSEGVAYHAEIKAEDKTQRKLTLLVPQEMNIANGDKYAFGDYSEETFQAIVTSMQFNADWTCDITLQDYIPELYDSLFGDIPEFKATITRPIEQKWELTTTPIISTVDTDESVLLVKQDGTIIPRAMVVLSTPTDIDDRARFVSVDYSLHDKNEWLSIAKGVDINTTRFFTENVVEGEFYDFRAYYSGAAGEASKFTFANNIQIIGKTSLPPSVQNFVAVTDSSKGVKLSWDKIELADINSYRISGDATAEVVGNEVIVQVLNKAGTLSFNIVAVDTGGRVSEVPTVATVLVSAPDAPVFDVLPKTDGLYLQWDNASTTYSIRHYLVTDKYTSKTHTVLTESLLLTERPAGRYNFSVQAVDIFGNASVVSTKNVSIDAPAKPEVEIAVESSQVRAKWSPVASSFPLAKYQIYSLDNVLLHETANTYYDIIAPAGIINLCFYAVDTAGNKSLAEDVSFELTAPLAPTVTVKISEDKKQVEVSWAKKSSMLPIIAYDVVRQYSIIRSDGIQEDFEEDYGRFDVDFFTVLPLTSSVKDAEHEFMVRCVDSAGNTSPWGSAVLQVQNPNKAVFTSYNTLDNNVLLYWNEPILTTFAIREYRLYSVEDGYPALLGTIDARFASQWEDESGDYTYRLIAVDLAGNISLHTDVLVHIDEPPDFILYHEKESLFNGIKNGFALDGDGGMIGYVDTAETWAQNTDRVGGLIGKAGSEVSWQDKSNAGYLYPFSPADGVATYVETVDVGTVIASTRIQIIVTQEKMEDEPVLSCKIETSKDGVTFKTVTENAFATYATQFRYVRYTLSVKNGIIRLSNLKFKLSVKKRTDYGEGDYLSSMGLDGLTINFNTNFIAVSGAINVTVLNNKPTGGNYPYMAIVDFENIERPKSFKVIILDKNGTPVDSKFSWNALGV